MFHNDSVVAICADDEKIRQAVRKLQQSGFDTDKFSVVGNSPCSGADKPRGPDAAEMVRKWGIPSGTIFFSIPDDGTIAVGGPLITAIAEGQETGASETDLSVLGVGLQRCGVPRSNVASYETAVKSRNRLVIVHCAPGEAVKAKEILEPLQLLDIAVHHI